LDVTKRHCGLRSVKYIEVLPVSAVKRGAGELDGQEMFTIVYDGYGPGGTAVMVDCLTDNRNRTVALVRNAFSKRGGSLGTDGSVSYLFDKKGVISYDTGIDEDAIMDAALSMIPSTSAALDEKTAPKFMGLLDTLEDLDDVQDVYHNAEISDEIAAKL
jgi:transcriptional/translational regulatory protein YebC/TACO1